MKARNILVGMTCASLLGAAVLASKAQTQEFDLRTAVNLSDRTLLRFRRSDR